MVRYGIVTPGQQQLLLLQQRYAMMEHQLQQQQQQQQLLQLSPSSPGQKKDSEQSPLSRQINCVYITEAKPAAFSFGVTPENAGLCTISGNLPTHRSSVSSSGAASSSVPAAPGGNAALASNTPPPPPAAAMTQTRTPFMISDILDSSSSSSRRTCNSTSSSNAGPDEQGSRSYGGYCYDPSSGRDSPRSVVSDDAESKEREDSVGASDSDMERSSQTGK